MLKKQLFFLICVVSLLLYQEVFCMQDGSAHDYLLSISNNIMLSRSLYVAADLELADHLQTPISIQELAMLIKVDQSALERLLNCLVEHNIFAYENGLICNNEVSLFLQKNHPHSVWPFILHDDPTRWNAMGNLGYSIKTGKASFDDIYHTDYFSYLKNDSLLSDRFDQAMTIISQQEDLLISQKIDFSGIIADIGGGKGQLLECIDQNNENISQLILFDLQQVQNNITSQNNRITSITGSFFDPIPIQADIFILKRILHDWDDKKALNILCNVAANMNENNTLYIVDAVIDECKNKKLILNIDLLLLTIFGGKERTKAEFEALCYAADLEICAIYELTPISHIIECRKKK